MTSVQGHGRPRREPPFIVPSVAPSVAPPNFSLSSKSSDKLSDQPAGLLGTKLSVANAPVAATNVPKYSEDDLQKIFKTVLKTWAPVLALAPAPAPVPAPVVSEVS